MYYLCIAVPVIPLPDIYAGDEAGFFVLYSPFFAAFTAILITLKYKKNQNYPPQVHSISGALCIGR